MSYAGQPWALPVAVLAGLALLLGLTHFVAPGEAGAGSPPETGRAPLGRTTVVCPEPSAGRIAVATAPGGNGTGRAVVRTLGGAGASGSRLGTISRRGVVWTEATDGQTPAVTVRAKGSMASSLEVEQLRTTGTGPGEGMSATSCTRPDTSSWFVSDGVRLGSTTVLYLVNPDDKPVSVSVDVYGRDGPVESAAGSGITVPPNGRVSMQLGALAPKVSVAALHVRSETGPVVAALHAKAQQGDGPLGTEWVPQTAEPSRKLVIPGVPDGSGSRRLLLAVPGSSPAKVRIRVVTTEGTYAPKGKEVRRVPAGTVTGVPLAETLSGRASAVRITSDRPVTAAVAVGSNDGLAYASAVSPLRGSAVMAAGGGKAGAESILMLSAPMRAGAARVTMFGEDGPVGGSDVVRIPSARTVAVELSPPSRVDGDYGVAVTPVEGSGPIYGARMLRRDAGGKTLLTVLPLRTSSSWVRVPDAEESLSVVSRR